MIKLLELNYDVVASIEYSYETLTQAEYTKYQKANNSDSFRVKNNITVVNFLQKTYQESAFSLDHKCIKKLNDFIEEFTKDSFLVTKEDYTKANELPF